MAELFQGKALSSKTHTEVDAQEALQNRVVGLYFSAMWCPPCRNFTPLLKEVYEELKTRGAPFEVVFVSSDKTPQDLRQYMMDHHGDWFFVPFGDPLISELKKKYYVTSIPSLFIVKPNGDIITPLGRKQIQDRGVSCFTSWSQAMERV